MLQTASNFRVSVEISYFEMPFLEGNFSSFTRPASSSFIRGCDRGVPTGKSLGERHSRNARAFRYKDSNPEEESQSESPGGKCECACVVRAGCRPRRGEIVLTCITKCASPRCYIVGRTDKTRKAFLPLPPLPIPPPSRSERETSFACTI